MLREKYNMDGEWRPLQYEGNTDLIVRKIESETDNEMVRGCLFYIRTTGFKVIEFVVKGSVYLPAIRVDLENGVHLIPCYENDETKNLNNTFINDGWVTVPDDKPETIQSFLDTINYTINLMSFVFDCNLKWVLKYRIYDHRRGSSLPTNEHIALLKRLNSNLLGGDTRKYLEAALDWFAHGQSANNIFNRYLSYWIAMEGIAIALYERKLGNLFDIDRTEREPSTIGKCIDEIFAGYFSKNKKNCVEKAYFDCIRSLKYRTQKGLEAVFGRERDIISTIYKPIKDETYSLEDIRHKITHGEFVEWDFSEENIVRKHLYRLKEICYEFIMRILISTKPQDKLPDLEKELRLSLSGCSPNTFMVVSNAGMLVNKDWKIKSEWIDELLL